MPERRRSTFRAPGAIDAALLAEGATPEEATSTAVDAEELATAPEAVEPSAPARRRRGFRAAPTDAGSAADVGETPVGAVDSDAHEAAVVESGTAEHRPDVADAAPESSTPVDPEPEAAPAGEPAARHHQPRHRADHVRNRRPSGGARRFAALSCTTAILGVSAFGAVAAAADAPDAPSLLAGETVTVKDTVAAGAADEIVSTPVVDDGPTITSGLSTASVPFTGGTQITVTGEDLDQVGTVSVAGVPATIVAADESAVTFAVPATTADALGGVEVKFADASGEAVPVEETVTSIAAAGVELSATTVEPTEQLDALTLTYTSNPAIDAQLGYVLAHWSDYNSAEYTVLSGVDCANFASQSLIARGWAMDAGWYYDRATGAMSPSWSSSTAMRDWLSTRPDLATPLDDSQRGLVKVGDIAQFDWDGSGDRDHTAVVTRVEHSANGTSVWVGGHTKDADYWNVDEALATGGGAVTYFSLR
ncbi:amidase domain-containing protein [Agromyces lapidis]|uniref:Amidase domain-containing protein n=1 Tax=Agromyces lapidis TaxID=279574 RepID=A0ABV5STF5_9MICO|nr:amidase domain-containing protein [Agromyces lapidis]